MKPITATRATVYLLEIAALLLAGLCGLRDPLFWPVYPWPYVLLSTPPFALALVVVLVGELKGESDAV